MFNKLSISYKDSGVNIDNSNSLIKNIKKIAKKTYRSEVISDIGGFNSLCNLPQNYVEPVLVSTTDGIGTKSLLAIDTEHYKDIGIDLVAMCVNDLIVCGAEPLFFLDYYSTSKLNIKIATSIINSIAEGCLISGCTLIGGETAEMPGMYLNQDYDIAGFCVGVVEKSKIINGRQVSNGDVLIAFSSSGPHANGYSLIRNILKINNINPLIYQLDGKSLLHHLIEPTRIYVKKILKLIQHVNIKAIIHITGGGLLENIPRVLPNNTQAVINERSWEWPSIFNWIQRKTNITNYEMYRIFNCGVGMLIIVNPIEVDKTISFMNNIHENVWKIGLIKHSHDKERVLFIK
ncbi:phosphoribosylformylglycinamidine cyclo-ligase [Candidatus Pantoea edessiphila]|uniref:Phosphoribosylformylglycinamidine cyclo-ligase n=1 Tax=Candidatus Pantoea edessiphila TaxID=2044610 RepID=A0A2P5T101_9GAMM|nr:phosphoribosylformylglycinamidine cyclo-ligase [Candidatus Pantoea edessiphila]PPI88255.1 phosphoribosylformylglycinamidine cyclo-ligase [Candidatus Pantoea edessiphila]